MTTKLLRRLFLLIHFASFVFENESIEFDKTFVGAVFSPYNKFHDDKQDYTIQEIETMLGLVAKRFQKITTYGMGTWDSTSLWNGTNDAEGRVAYAAAMVNKNNLSSKDKLIVDMGVWQGNGTITAKTKQEICNALAAASEANNLSPGTVSGIIMTTHDDSHPPETLLQSLLDNESKIKNLSLNMGIRSSACKTLSSAVTGTIVEIISKLDFIICHILPAGPSQNIPKFVSGIGDTLKNWQDGFRRINPKIRISGQTGWPSKERSNEEVIGSVDNMKAFWLEMNEWAKTNKFRVDIFTAFDEPWKPIENMPPVEGNYGWWKRISNDSNGEEAFAEKIYYQEPGASNGLAVALSFLGAVVVIGLISSIVFLYCKLNAVQSQLLTKADIEEFEKGKQNVGGDNQTEDALRLPYDRSYEIPKSKFMIDRASVLGSGAFGTVYKGKLDRDDSPNDVAFKMTQPNCSANNLKSLLSEIKIMIHVGKHPNVVSIIGAYTGEIRQGCIMIAIELCDLGSLEKYLRSNKQSFVNFSASDEAVRYKNDPTSNSKPTTIQLTDLITWAHQISCGMEHISAKNVIHADLATRNVLLTSDGGAKSVKITDFGLSRRLYEYTNYVKSSQEPLPWRWMSLESLQQMTFSTKSDVWSFGITLWEIFSLGDTPYPGLSWTVDFTQELLRGLRLSQPQYATPAIYSKMCNCWALNPEERPDFSDMKDFFEALLRLQENITMGYANLNSGQPVYQLNHE